MAWQSLSDRQWESIRVQLPRSPRRRGRGRPAAEARQCFDGILWILWTGAPWSALPSRYGSKGTVHRRLYEWSHTGVLLNLWRAFLTQLNDRQRVHWDECFVDGTFVTAKKGAVRGAHQARQGNEAHGIGRWRGYSGRSGRGAGDPAEVTLLEPLLETIPVRDHPQRLIGDRGYDSNTVRNRLVDRGIDPIIPARSGNRRATHQDGRKLRRYRRRWIIERTHAWLHGFRRLVVRYERSPLVYLGLVHMACALIALRRIWG